MVSEDRIFGDLIVTYSKYNKLKVIYKNYEYMVASTTAKHIWLRCTCEKEHNCPARLKISKEESAEPFSILGQSKRWHNHMPKHDAQLLADAAVRLMVANAVETTESYASIYSRVLSELPREARRFVKKMSLCKDAMYRARKKFGQAEPSTINELVLEGAMRETADGDNWVLYQDDPEETDNMLVLASDPMLRNMSGASVLLMDGMFDVPALMYQLYTIHAIVEGASMPVAFAMLPKKDTPIYSKLLEKILEGCDDRGIERPDPDAVVVDFELAAVKAIEKHFPRARITGCHFHLNQSLQRFVKQKQNVELLQNTNFSMLLTKLVFMAYLRFEDIPGVWQTLLKGCKSPQEKKLATHFGKSYVRGAKKGKQYEKAHFKLQIWNLHHAALNGEPTTNNSAEAWHRHIQVMLKDTNMSFCSFIEKLRHSLVSHENKVEQIRLGRETPTRNPKTIKKYEKIRSFLKVYDEKTPLEILDMLAYNLKVD